MRGLAGSLLLALVSVVFALALAELVVRALPDEQEVAPAPPPAPLPPELQGLPRLHSVRDLIAPNQRGVFKGVLYRTNSRGVHGPEYAPVPPPGTFRIVVVGDSYTMGQGVPEDEAYPAVAQAVLNARGDGVHYEVLNLGVSGFSIHHSMRRLEKVGLGYHPHLVVYGFTPNDIMGADYVETTPEQRQALREELDRFRDSPSKLLRLVWPRLVLARSALWPLPGTYEHTLEDNYFRNAAAARSFAEGLDELARVTRARGICGHVFIHTRMNQLWIHPFTRIYRHVAKLARERGLTAQISYPFFRGRDASALRISVVDTHPNAEGQRLHAEALVAGLDELPPECFRPESFEPLPEPPPAARVH